MFMHPYGLRVILTCLTRDWHTPAYMMAYSGFYDYFVTTGDPPTYCVHLAGSLPSEWGTPGAFPQLLLFSALNNELSGSLPDAWYVH